MILYKRIIEEYVDETGIYKNYLLKKTSLMRQIRIIYLYLILRILRKQSIAQNLGSTVAKEYQRARAKVMRENESLIDITDLRNTLIEGGEYNLSFDTKYTFYYDETNNYRVFRIKNGKFNESPQKYFVVGGLCLDSENGVDFEQLEEELHLPQNLEEIKGGVIVGNNASFIECMRSRRLNSILKWVDQNGILLHFEAVDHLEIIAKDLCRLCGKDIENEYICEYIFYKCLRQDIEEVEKLLVKYKYPNIENGKIKDFLVEWRMFILKVFKVMNDDLSIDLLAKKIFLDSVLCDIDKAINSNLSFKGRDKIIENYFPYYIVKPMIFRKAEHIFDDEKEIEKILKENIYIIEGEYVDNYLFVDSKAYKMVQISDVMVRVVAKFLEFVNSFEIGEKTIYSVLQLNKRLTTQIQRENFELFMKIIRKSRKENELLIRIKANFVNMNALDLLTSVTDVDNDGVSFVTIV